ncbi:MAG: alpha/beta fold hydrolase [Burkholderiales bacterium]|nr:alpha/beta fold hydrolase [Burkholderiales bacterium]
MTTVRPDGAIDPDLPPLDAALLPDGVRARFVDGVNGLRMHVLEAGHADGARPMLLLLHGFPELAYSWRATMPALADAGWHVVAPDQRGYGRTTGWTRDYDADLAPFRMANLVRDALGLVAALGRTHVDAVIGHDFGSPVAAWCALMRPDAFRAVAMMSSPFAGPPPMPPLGGGRGPRDPEPALRALAALPRPRKHYQWYYSSREADADMVGAPQGLHAFLRAYYHHKSADWPENRPYPLRAWEAEELAKLPTYYVMDLDADMAATVAPHMPSAEAIAACRWLPDDALRVYAGEYARTGFQGGLQWYRCRTTGRFLAEEQTWAGRTFDVPSLFVAGASDWGIHQVPGALETTRTRACTRMLGCELVEGAGHWVQQERPGDVVRLLLDFLRAARA